jgi:hypothetical protein
MLQDAGSRIRFRMWSLVFSIDLILSAALWPWGRLTGVRQAHKTDNLTAMCEPIVSKMWES